MHRLQNETGYQILSIIIDQSFNLRVGEVTITTIQPSTSIAI